MAPVKSLHLQKYQTYLSLAQDCPRLYVRVSLNLRAFMPELSYLDAPFDEPGALPFAPFSHTLYIFKEHILVHYLFILPYLPPFANRQFRIHHFFNRQIV